RFGPVDHEADAELTNRVGAHEARLGGGVEDRPTEVPTTRRIERRLAGDDLGVAGEGRVRRQGLGPLPAEPEPSLTAIADIERDRERTPHHWRQRIERARYEVERAERQYQAEEPENRLVARTLEGRWEEAMRGLRQVEEEYDRFLRGRPACLSEEERACIRELSRDMPALWGAPATTAAD